ncbi:MAG: C-GCAxxG-C-C family (seleno)protein [Eubacteriales bacterium]
MEKRIVDLQKIKREAELYMSDLSLCCSESVLKTIKDEFGREESDDIIALASGFIGGVGIAQSLCGAISGGVMTFGMFFGRNEPNVPIVEARTLSLELHNWFEEKYGSVLCKDLLSDVELGATVQRERCMYMTGEVAYETARLICEKLKIEYTL